MTTEELDTPVAIVGAGPHGLATAAHLRAAHIEPTVFGDPMQFWRDQMPAGMLLRSSRRASNIASPQRDLTLDAWSAATGRPPSNPVTLSDFVAYGEWYQRQAVPDVDRRRVDAIEHVAGGFRLTLGDRTALTARRVVVAAGIAPFPRVPEALRSLPAARVSHSSAQSDLSAFSGRRVAVLGGGQSALESAALLAEAGAAAVEVIYRGDAVWWLGGPPTRKLHWPTAPTDIGGRVTSWLAASPDVFRRLPRSRQPELAFRCIRPAGAHWLRDRLDDVQLTFDRTIVGAAVNGAVELTLSDGSRREVDHLLLATGYEVDVRRYPFLSPNLVRELRLDGGYPVLRPGLESSIAGLHFVGAPAAISFGPVMRFVTGTWYDAPAVATSISGARQRPVRWSF